MRNSTTRGKALASAIAKARYLVVIQGYSLKETANLIGYSEKAVGSWNRRYNWRKDAVSKQVHRYGGLNAVMEGFFKVLEKHWPNIAEPAKVIWNDYMKKINENSG